MRKLCVLPFYIVPFLVADGIRLDIQIARNRYHKIIHRMIV